MRAVSIIISCVAHGDGPCTTFRPFVPPTPQSFIDSPPARKCRPLGQRGTLHSLAAATTGYVNARTQILITSAFYIYTSFGLENLVTFLFFKINTNLVKMELFDTHFKLTKLDSILYKFEHTKISLPWKLVK